MKQLFYAPVKSAMGEDTKYSRAITIPQYKPSEKKPHLEELFDCAKYSQLMKNINESNVSDDEKQFLRFAASRHISFNYAKIADYYAHSDKEMQELMEQSALVILDIEDAMMNGYVNLSKKMAQLVEEAKKKKEEKNG